MTRVQEHGFAGVGQVIEKWPNVHFAGPTPKKWDKKHQFCKNEPEKLLKTNKRPCKMGQNEPENEPEKLFRISTCGKNEPERTGKRTGPSC